MTREKYESLPLSTLKALAKSRNMKGISTLRKEALIERMLEEDQKENQKNMEEPAVLKEEKKTEIPGNYPILEPWPKKKTFFYLRTFIF